MEQLILKYDGSLEGFLSCVFTAYREKLDVYRILVDEETSGSLFYRTREITTDVSGAERVWNALESKASRKALKTMRWAFLSELDSVRLDIYRMIRYIFSEKHRVDDDYSHPAVLRVYQAAKKVSREKHRMEAFVRFRLTKDQIYFAGIEPDFNVLPIIAGHFKSRYADQRWIIYDLRRKYGISYNGKEVDYVKLDLDPGLPLTGASGDYFDIAEEEFQKLWSSYFEHTNIKSRKNAKLHIQHLPKRYWKYLTEKTSPPGTAP